MCSRFRKLVDHFSEPRPPGVPLIKHFWCHSSHICKNSIYTLQSFEKRKGREDGLTTYVLYVASTWCLCVHSTPSLARNTLDLRPAKKTFQPLGDRAGESLRLSVIAGTLQGLCFSPVLQKCCKGLSL